MKRKVTKPPEPSKASLREMPEVAFANARVRRNPYAARIREEGIQIVRKRTTTGASPTTSVMNRRRKKDSGGRKARPKT
jgi:hypothetical protein